MTIAEFAGIAASMGAFLLAAGTKGKRFALPNSQVMIHQPLGGMQGQATEIEIHAQELEKMRVKINAMISKETGQTVEKVSKDTDRDFWMTADEAKIYNLVAKVVTSRKELP